MRVAPGLLRLKVLLVTDGWRIVLALVLVAAMAFGATAVSVADPPQRTVTENRHAQTVGMELRSSAVVTGDSELYERGTRLEGLPVYLRSATPNVTLELDAALPEAASRIRVTPRLWLTYTAERDGEVFWQERQPLLEQGARPGDTTGEPDGAAGEPDGERATAQTELRVSRIATRVRTVRSELDGVGQVSVTLHGAVEYETGRYEGVLSGSSPVQVTERAYWFDDDIAAETTHTTAVEDNRIDEQRASIATLPVIGRLALPHIGALAGISGIGCLFAAAWIRLFRRRNPGEGVLRERLERERFDEWISRGRVPEDLGDRTVTVGSLADLVDVAIDSSNRVVHDPERGCYVVIDDTVVYRYHQRTSESGAPTGR